MKDVVIKSTARMAVGNFQGAFSGMTAVQLRVVAVRRAGIDEVSVEECLTGCVLRAGLLQEAVAAVGLCRPDCRTTVSFR
jgi:acetyl-CoA C-acetyltransferase